jgi:hypothetical protein
MEAPLSVCTKEDMWGVIRFMFAEGFKPVEIIRRMQAQYGDNCLSPCLTKHHAMKTCWGSGGIAPRILDLGTGWRWMVSFAPRPLYPHGKSPWYPLDTRLGGPRAVLDTVVKRNIPSSRRESNPRTPIVHPVAQRYTDWAITALLVTVYRAVKFTSGYITSKREELLYALRRDQEGVTVKDWETIFKPLKDGMGKQTNHRGRHCGGFRKFGPMKESLRGRFSPDEEIIGAVQNWLKTQPK